MVPARFVLALAVVCNRDFQSPGLRKHSGVGLELPYNGADWLRLSLVNTSLSNLFSSSAVHGGVVDVFLSGVKPICFLFSAGGSINCRIASISWTMV